MPERRYVVRPLVVSYEGYFSARELYRLITDWFVTKNYDVLEKRADEFVRDEKKQIIWQVENDRRINDYIKHIIGVTMTATDVRDVTVEVDGRKRKLQHGHVQVRFIAFVDSDLEGKWEQYAWRWYIRIVTEKFLLKREFDEHIAEVTKNTKELRDLVKSYLNVHKHLG